MLHSDGFIPHRSGQVHTHTIQKETIFFWVICFWFIVINENLCTDYGINTYAITTFHCIPLKAFQQQWQVAISSNNNRTKLMKTRLILALSTSIPYLPNSILIPRHTHIHIPCGKAKTSSDNICASF